MSAIELHGLTKRFGAVTAVDDLTLELDAGKRSPTMKYNTNPSTRPTRRQRRAGIAVVALLAAGYATTGCAGNIYHNYRSFESALDRGASCSELYDQRARFDDEDTLAKIDGDLARIGCTSPNATRTD